MLKEKTIKLFNFRDKARYTPSPSRKEGREGVLINKKKDLLKKISSV
jgi:hypothetical protein